jgi:hypothetical protein
VRLIETYADAAARAGAEAQQSMARTLSFSIARTEAAMLMLEHAAATSDRGARIAAERWCDRDLTRSLMAVDNDHLAESRQLVIE